MKAINVYDNFISDKELEEAYQFIDKEYPDDSWLKWYFNSTDRCWKKNLYISKINTELVTNNISTCPDTLVMDFILKMKNRIEKYTKLNFEIIRAYLNRQNYGENVPVHTDDVYFNTYTFLIYLGDITPENFDVVGGILEFKDREHTKIEPFTKRAVLFESNIPHAPHGPLIPGVTRISLAIKLISTTPFIIRYN